MELSALIEVGRGNNPVHDPGWPLGALDVANLKSRVGWWEGPPFGGGQWQFLYEPFTVELGKRAQIGGVVMDTYGKPMSQFEGNEVLVGVEPKEGSGIGSWGGSGKVKADGTMEFENVPPGEYRVTSRPNPSSTSRRYAAEHIVTVAPGARAEVKVVYE